MKGLAEMTNQSSALREPEREQEHLRPPPHITPKSETLDATISSNPKRLKSDRSSQSPTLAHQQNPVTQSKSQSQSQQQQQSQSQQHSPHAQHHHSILHQSQSQLSQRQLSPSPSTPLLSSYPRKVNRDYNIESSTSASSAHNDDDRTEHGNHSLHKLKTQHSVSMQDDHGPRSMEDDEGIDDEEEDAMSDENGKFYSQQISTVQLTIRCNCRY